MRQFSNEPRTPAILSAWWLMFSIVLILLTLPTIENVYAKNFVEKGKDTCADRHIEPGSEFGFQELDETEFPTLEQGNTGTCSHHSSLQLLQYLYHHHSAGGPKAKERFSLFPVFCDQAFEEGGLAHVNLYNLRSHSCLTKATERELADWKKILEQAKALRDKICMIPSAHLCVDELRTRQLELSSGALPHDVSEEEVRKHYETESEPTRSGKIAYSTVVKSVCSKDERDRVPLPPYNIHVVDLGPEMQAKKLRERKKYFLETANTMLGKGRPITPMVVSFCTDSRPATMGPGEECDPGKRHGTTLIGSRRNCCGSTCTEEWLIQDSGGMRGWNNAELLAESMSTFGGGLIYVRNCGGHHQEECTPHIQGSYPLHYLIETKDVVAAKRFLHSIGTDRAKLTSTVLMKDSYGRTPAHAAVLYGDPELVGMTSAAGLVEDQDHKTPVQRAIELGRTDVLDSFLSNPEIRTAFFESEFDHIVNRSRPYYSLLHPTKKITLEEVEEEDEASGLTRVEHHEVEVIDTDKKNNFAKSLAHILKMEKTQKLLKSPEKKRKLEVLASWLPLWATQGKYPDVLQELAKIGDPAIFSHLDDHHRSLLDWAVQNSDLQSVRTLLSVESGRNSLKVVDDSGNSPFHWFSFGGGTKTTELLREMASHLDPIEDMFLLRNRDGRTPIQQTSGSCDELVAFLSVLLEQRTHLSSIRFAEIIGTLSEKIIYGKSLIERIPLTNCKGSIPLLRQLAVEVADLPELLPPTGPLRTKTLHLAPAPSGRE